MSLTWFRQEFFERKLKLARSIILSVFKEEEAFFMRHLSSAGRDWWERFQQMLDENVEWPSEYMFKFIVPQHNLDELKSVFGRIPIKVRASSKGKYYSVTAKMEMHSSDEVIAIYSAAANVKGIISL